MTSWNRSNTIALAHPKCTQCHGLGMRRTQKHKDGRACNCVLRAIFRACYNRFRFCVEKEKHITQATLDFAPGGTDRRFAWGRKDEEYVADFFLVSKRTLNEDEWKLFRFHFLLGADWRLCSMRMGVDRGTFFHAVYRVEQKLGKVFMELEPYALFPLDEYFGGTVRREEAAPPDPDPLPEAAKPQPLLKRPATLLREDLGGGAVRRVVPIRPPMTVKPPVDNATIERKAA